MKGKRRAIPAPPPPTSPRLQEAFNLLDLIDAEFRTDPMSQQCFDSRIVVRVRAWVKNREAEGLSPQPHAGKPV